MRSRAKAPLRLALSAALAIAIAACGDQTPVTTAPKVVVPPKADPAVPVSGPEVDMVANADLSYGGAIFRQSTFETSAGTGLVNPFLKTNSNDAVYNAFNTSGTKPTTVTSNDDTRDIPLSWVPQVFIDPDGAGPLPPAMYREIRLDNNEPNNDTRLLSLDVFKVYTTNAGLVPTNNLAAPNDSWPDFTGKSPLLVYDLDATQDSWIKMDANVSNGSGGGDIFFYIPETAFGTRGAACPFDGATLPGCGYFLYLQVRFGDHYANEGGFEEFAVRRLPYVTKTGTYKYDNNVSWTIDKKIKKSADGSYTDGPITFDLWNTESGTANYQIAVTKSVTAVNNRVEGSIIVHNPTDNEYPNVVVTDLFDPAGLNIAGNVTCPTTTLPAGSKNAEATLTCTYTVPLQAPLTTDKVNTATATFELVASPKLDIASVGKVTVSSTGQLGNTVGQPGTVTVTDNFDGGGAATVGTASATGTTTFTSNTNALVNRTFTCATDKGTHTNVASINTTPPQTDQTQAIVNCYSLSVTKTATPAQGDVFDWTVLKEVTPASRTMYVNDQGEFQYTVTYTKGAPVSTRTVGGTVTVENPAASSGNISVAAPTDQVIAANGDPAINVALTCPGGAFPRSLAPGASFQCTYSAVPLPNGNARTNRASAQGTIPTSNSKTFSGDAAISFAAVVPSTTNNAVSIADPNDPSTPRGPFTASGSFNYIVTKTCGASPSGPTAYENTATMTSTDGLSKTSKASISVTCVAATVTKTSVATFRRSWQWDITKSRGLINGQPAPSSLTLQPGQSFIYPYSVRVFTTGYSDDLFSASGTITVTGSASVPGSRSFTMTDAIAGGLTPTVSCTGGNPRSITGAGPIACTWPATSLPDATTRLNTATATLQNVKYQIVGGPTNLSGTTTAFTGTASITFPSTPTTLRDNCVKVVDVAQHKSDQGSPLGSAITNQLTSGNYSICVSGSPGSADQTITYNTTIGPMDQFAACGNFRFDNTATLTTNTTGTTDDSSLQTPISVDCPQGCTLTQGYWKTHNASFGADKKGGRKGPPVHDWSAAPAWTDWYQWKFFGGTPDPVPPTITAVPLPVKSTPTWFANFTTAPQGNPYYQASHQFMAAVLNVANGAPAGAINTQLTAAYTFFLTANPNTNWSDSQRTQLLAWNTLFGSYNEGTLSALHCSEDATSSNAP